MTVPININRRNNDIPSCHTFPVSELVGLTKWFYRHRLWRGLFLSSGVVQSDYTIGKGWTCVICQEPLVLYSRLEPVIHLQKASRNGRRLVKQTRTHTSWHRLGPANRNLKERIWVPTLKKDHKYSYQPIRYISSKCHCNKAKRKKCHVHAVPAGQNTQMIVSVATTRSDKTSFIFFHSAYHGGAFTYSGFISK